MGNRYRQPPDNLVRRTINIANRVDKLESTPRATNTAVDTGRWKFIASNGVDMVDFGDQGPGLGRGWLFRRGDTGKPAFYLGGNQVSGNQFWRLVDNSLNDIITDDAQSSQGLARPYIPYAYTRYSEVGAAAQTTSLTTFVGAYTIDGYKQHPVLDVSYIVFTPAGVSAEVILFDGTTSTIIAGPNSHPGSSFTYANLRGPLDGPHMSNLSVQLQYRVSAGAGTIGVTCIYAYGHQS